MIPFQLGRRSERAKPSRRAPISKKDAHHARVVEVFRTFRNLRLADHLLTTNHVIAETITLTLKVGHAEAARIGEQLYADKLARIHWASPEEERAAFAYFKRHPGMSVGRPGIAAIHPCQSGKRYG